MADSIQSFKKLSASPPKGLVKTHPSVLVISHHQAVFTFEREVWTLASGSHQLKLYDHYILDFAEHRIDIDDPTEAAMRDF